MVEINFSLALDDFNIEWLLTFQIRKRRHDRIKTNWSETNLLIYTIIYLFFCWGFFSEPIRSFFSTFFHLKRNPFLVPSWIFRSFLRSGFFHFILTPLNNWFNAQTTLYPSNLLAKFTTFLNWMPHAMWQFKKKKSKCSPWMWK